MKTPELEIVAVRSVAIEPEVQLSMFFYCKIVYYKIDISIVLHNDYKDEVSR